MDEPGNHFPTPMRSGGSDRGFWIEMLLLLGGVILIYLFRPQIEILAAHPGEAAELLAGAERQAEEEILHVVPIIGAIVAALAVLVLAFRRWWIGPVPVPRSRPGRSTPLRLGRYRGTRATYALPRDATFDHALILGRTRAGKSQHAVSLALQDLDRGDCALVLIDPHDELCRSFVAAGYTALRHRPVTWLSFGDGAYVPGFDLLERAPGESPSMVAERLGDLVDWLFFAGASTDHERLTNNLRLAAWACASLDRSLLDCRLFLTDPRYRAATALQLTDEYLREAIRELNETLRHDPTFAQSAVNRLANLTDNEALRRIVGQPTTFDLGAILDQRGVLLVSLDEVALGEKGVYLLAGMLLHRIAGHLKRRPKDDHGRRNPKVRIILDEAQRYQVGLLQGMVGELAGRGASVSLITQGLTQFAEPRLRSYLLNNVATYSVFTIADHEAEILARELFVAGANRVGLVDERGRPVHVLSIQEQLAEQKRLLTRQKRREFVALARGRPSALCGSFEVCLAVQGSVVETFRRACAERSGQPRREIDRRLQARLRVLRAAARDDKPSALVTTPETRPNPPDASPTSVRRSERDRTSRVRSRRAGWARRAKASPETALPQLPLEGFGHEEHR